MLCQHCVTLWQHVVLLWLESSMLMSGLLLQHVVCCDWKSCILIAFVAIWCCCDWKSCILIGWAAFFSKRWQHFCWILRSDWLTGLGEGGHFLSKFLNSFVILKQICNRSLLSNLFEKEYHSSVNFDADPKSILEIKKFLVDIPFPGEGSRKRATYKNTQDRLDKSCSALVEAWLTNDACQHYVMLQ